MYAQMNSFSVWITNVHVEPDKLISIGEESTLIKFEILDLRDDFRSGESQNEFIMRESGFSFFCGLLIPSMNS